MLVAQILSLLYNIVDRIYIARIPDIGTTALGAVGLCFPIIVIITAFSNLFGSGGAPLFSIERGKGDHENACQIMHTSFSMLTLCSILLMLTGLIFAKPILTLFGAGRENFDYACPYLMIYLLGTFPSMVATGMNPFINAQGYSTIGMLSVAIGAVANLLLDPLFIFVLGFGVRGAAIATVISQAVSALLCMNYIRHSQVLIITKQDWKLDGQCCKQLLGMGLPMGLQYSITAIGSILLQTGINGLGSHAVAAVSTGNKVTQVICCPLDALGTTVATYGGQNIGAKKLDRISKGMRTCVAFGLIYSVIAFFLIKYFGPTLLSLFIGAEETSVLADAQYFIMHWVAFCAPLTFVYVFRFMIQGLGFSKLAVFAGVFEMLARGLISLFWIPAAGFEAVCFASPVAWIAADVFLVPAYLWVRKKLHREFGVTAD